MKTMYRVGLALGLVAGAAVAQNPPAPAQPKAAPQPRVQPAQPVQPGAMGRMGQPGQMMRGQPDRAQLEQQIRARIGNQLKKGLNLSDDQFAKLQATNKRFEERRHLLVENERDARMGMRDLMIAGDTTNSAKVSASLDKMLQIQRQRFELIEQEQKELAGYLTPMQRARYLGMQEQMFRRVEQLRAQQRGRGGPGGPPMGGGGMGPGAGQGMGQGMGRGMQPGMGQGMGRGMQPGMGQGQPGPGVRLRQQRPPQGPRGPLNVPPTSQPPELPPTDVILP